MWLVMDVLEIMFVLGIFGLIAGLMWFDGPRGLLNAIRNPPIIPVVGAREMAIWYRNVLIPCTSTVDHSISLQYWKYHETNGDL